jgi:hypothetical protein
MEPSLQRNGSTMGRSSNRCFLPMKLRARTRSNLMTRGCCGLLPSTRRVAASRARLEASFRCLQLLIGPYEHDHQTNRQAGGPQSASRLKRHRAPGIATDIE